MAPSGGHLLVPETMRAIHRSIFSKTKSVLRSKLLQSSTTTASTNAPLQSLNPLARIKQSRSQNSRLFSSKAAPNSTFNAKPHKTLPPTFPLSKVNKAITQHGTAPFASTLRPNLTGGTLPRSAGGYSLGGTGKGVRHFSHTPSAQAHAVQAVNAGIRAFFVGGGKARFDGVDAVTGNKRFRAVSQTENQVYKQWESPITASMKGTSLEFGLNPSITALSPSSSPSTAKTLNLDTSPTTLNCLYLLDNLASDYARALKDFAATLTDLRHLAAFGDLPIFLSSTPSLCKCTVITVRFPGCDADLVSRLCDEVGVTRGVIREDEGWVNGKEKDVEMALLFPFAPSGTSNTGSLSDIASEEEACQYFQKASLSAARPRFQEDLDWRNMMDLSTQHTPFSHTGSQFASWEDDEGTLRSPALNTRSHSHSHSPSGYESLRDSDFASDDPYFPAAKASSLKAAPRTSETEYEGLEGIYRFLQVCDESRR